MACERCESADGWLQHGRKCLASRALLVTCFLVVGLVLVRDWLQRSAVDVPCFRSYVFRDVGWRYSWAVVTVGPCP